MKKRIQINPVVLVASLLAITIIAACSSTKETSSPVTREELNKALQADSWVFSAINANPISGRSRYVGTGYTVRFSRDTMVVNLPYFGNLYGGAGYPSTQGPLDFKTTNFTTEKSEARNGGMVLMVRPKDYAEVQSMTFNLFETGTATLNVILTNRSAISFTGTVQPK